MLETNNAQNKNRSMGDYISDIGSDLKLIFLFNLVTVMFLQVPVVVPTALRLTFSLVMLFFIPGYAFIAALFPDNQDINLVERTALSFGLSICISPVIELLLSYTPWGLRLDSLVISLATFSSVCATVAIVRGGRLPKTDRFFVDFQKTYQEVKEALSADKTSYDRVLTFILVIAILFAGAMIAYAVVMHKPVDKFTEFYVLGPNDTADSYPTDLINGDSQKYFVGIVNHEYRTVNYDLSVQVNDGNNLYPLYHDDNISIANNQSMERPIILTLTHAGKGMRLEFLLYADSNRTAPYRECHFWINVNDS